jgi:hypothetical protein
MHPHRHCRELAGHDLTADEYLKHYKISRLSLLLWLVNHSIFHRYSIVADLQLQL